MASASIVDAGRFALGLAWRFRAVRARSYGIGALLRESGRDVRLERWQLLETGQPEPLEEVETGSVQERSTGGVGAPELDDEPPMKERPDGVVRVDAPDSLDGGACDGLAVRDDRERLEGRVRQAHGVRADVTGDQRAGLGRRRELHPVPGEHEPDASVTKRHLEVAETGVDGLPVDPGDCRDLAPRQRALG